MELFLEDQRIAVLWRRVVGVEGIDSVSCCYKHEQIAAAVGSRRYLPAIERLCQLLTFNLSAVESSESTRGNRLRVQDRFRRKATRAPRIVPLRDDTLTVIDACLNCVRISSEPRLPIA